MNKKDLLSHKNIAFALLVCVLLGASVRYFQKERYQGYVEGENLYIASPYEGKLLKKHVMRGERVHPKQLLFQIDPNPELLLKEQLSQAVLEAEHLVIDLKKPRRPLEIKALEDQVKSINANLSLASIRVKRYHDLYQTHAVDLDHLDEITSVEKQLEANQSQAVANLELGKLGARIDQIEAQQARLMEAKTGLMIGEWKLKQKTLIAPTECIVFDTYFQEGEFVPVGRPIAALLPLDHIRIEFFVPARVLPQLQLGQKVWFTCEGCAAEEEATIQYISPEAEYIPPLVYSRDNRDHLVFRLKATLKTPQKFKPGQPIEIVRWAHHV